MSYLRQNPKRRNNQTPACRINNLPNIDRKIRTNLKVLKLSHDFTGGSDYFLGESFLSLSTVAARTSTFWS